LVLEGAQDTKNPAFGFGSWMHSRFPDIVRNLDDPNTPPTLVGGS